MLAGSITAGQRYQLAREAGFNAADAIVMTAISLAECANCDMSKGYGDAVKQHGLFDRGLWQINDVHGYSAADMADPLKNAQAAYQVWKGGGFTQWCTYPGGCGGGPGVANFPALLTTATVAAGQVDPSAPAQIDMGGSGQQTTTSGTTDTTTAGQVTAGSSLPVIGGLQGAGDQIAAIGARLRSPGFWWAVFLFALALGGIVVGILLYFHTEAGDAVKTAAVAAA